MSSLEKTWLTYQSAQGAKAYMDKEASHAEARNQKVWSLLDGIAKPGKTAVDLGCGFGRDTAEMRQRGMRAWGVDISPVLLAEARKLHGGEDWVEADILRLAEPPEGPVDLVWSVANLVHVPRDMMPNLLARWWSWVKPGGYMVLVTKEGTGERMMDNLGKEYSRLMVYYRVQELLGVLEPLGARLVWQMDGETGHALPTGDAMMQIILRK